MSRKKKRQHLWALMLLMLYVFLEGASYLTLTLLDRWKQITFNPEPPASTGELYADLQRSNSLRVLSPTLGWTNKPGAIVDERMEGNAVINSQGIRADHSYAKDPPPCTVRIAVFGDSFTFGSELRNDQTWESVLERSSPHTEVLNFGVGGYGIDQALLRYRQEGQAYHPNVVLMGFISDDAQRNAHDVRYNVTKPIFTLEGGRLRLDETAASPGKIQVEDGRSYQAGPLDFLPSVRLFKIARSQFQRPRGLASKAVRLTNSLFDAFVADVRSQNAGPVIVFLPVAEDVAQYMKTGMTSYDPFLQRMRNKSFEVIDVMNAFKEHLASYSRGQYFGILHYNAAGAAKVGEYIHSELERMGLLNVPQGCQASSSRG